MSQFVTIFFCLSLICVVFYHTAGVDYRKKKDWFSRVFQVATAAGNAASVVGLVICSVLALALGEVADPFAAGRAIIFATVVLVGLNGAIHGWFAYRAFWRSGQFRLHPVVADGEPQPARVRLTSGARLPPTAEIDLRTVADCVVESQARQSLEDDLEELAKRVGQLGHDYQKMGDFMWEEMESIGRQLNRRGGLRLMQLVCNRARALGGRSTSVSKSWDGIGEWRH